MQLICSAISYQKKIIEKGAKIQGFRVKRQILCNRKVEKIESLLWVATNNQRFFLYITVS